MKSDFKFLVLLLIVMPFGIGSSFLIAPNKLLQALPGGYGKDLSLVQGDSRRYMNDWFDEILKESKAMTNTFTDGFNINIIDMGKAYNLLVDDMKKKGNLTYTTYDKK